MIPPSKVYEICGDDAMSKPVDMGSIKIGQYIVIDDEPCRVVEYEKSKPGK
jgi:translation initiation factor 5A